jgi:FkbM family methyltransferase
MNLVHRLKNFRFWLFYRLFTKTGVPLVILGDVCKWTFCDTGLNAASAVLCAGAGNDISFEKCLVERYRCKVVLLDPSPTGVATVQREKLAAGQLQFIPKGLAGRDGKLSFQNPADPAEGSFQRSDSAANWQFDCKSLATLMAELNWTRIELLKMDIEGSEYEVIHEMLVKRLDVRQLCVEFHYGPEFQHSRSEMIQTIFTLKKAGYDLVHHTCRDHTFLRRP